MLDERLPVDWHTSARAVVANPFVVGLPADELLAVIGESVTADDAQIAGSELQHQLGEHTRFEVAAVHTFGKCVASTFVGQQSPPAVGHPTQVQQWDLSWLAIHALGARHR